VGRTIKKGLCDQAFVMSGLVFSDTSASDQPQDDGYDCNNKEDMNQSANAEYKITKQPTDDQDHSKNIQYIAHDCLF
jgi:hypothetical protein